MGKIGARSLVGFVAVVLGVGSAALGWRWWGTAAMGPLASARTAYERKDWRQTETLARTALRERPGDVEAVRLLARALARLGRDEAAQELFGRLNGRALEAEDFYLLGSGLLRQGARGPAIAVLERARDLDPLQPDTQHELARLYARAERLGDALDAASRLAALPGWEARGSVIVGLLCQQRADPEGASKALEHAIEVDPLLQGAAARPEAVRRLLALALLQTGQPAKARTQLQAVLARGPDPEASWLVSRAFLQEGDASRAAEALAGAGEYGKHDPLRREPAPCVGAKACAECHASIYRDQQNSRHARTLLLPKDLTDFPLPKQPVPEPEAPNLTHAFSREGNTIRLDSKDGNEARHALVEYALGSGDRGLTMIGRDEDGMARAFRLSVYADRTIWDVTPNYPHPTASDPGSILGRPLSQDALFKCLDCHVTSYHAARDRHAPEAADRGVGCERCHGPGGNHLASVSAGFADLAIARPGLASTAQITRICAACHDKDDASITETDPRTVRFQASTMPKSRCYTESDGALSCLTCHDPHRDADTSAAHYESQCLSCHSATSLPPSRETRHAVLSAASRRVPCPVNPAKDCLSCHMPRTAFPAHHSTFTDHQIRIHRPTSEPK
jgi:tetratricopeptide (TPR) repeat protein